jgi:hypothetical protein
MSLLRRWFGGERQPLSARRRKQVCPALEGLETRVVLYSASGSAWPNPQLITISFMPDGTSLGGGVTSNLFSTFNNNANLEGKWESVILQAAQTWAQETNINFEVVPDDGAPAGSGADEQGDPGFGDIRIGGYNFNDSTLALTYQPPSSNNFSIAGDLTFNTGQSFNIGSTYDLYTVAMHEFGHALGLNESSVSDAVMYGTYTGRKTALASDDIEGIRSIYSSNNPRTADAYNTGGASNGTLSTAASINSVISTSTLTALVPKLDISTAGQSEYFSFTAPSGTGSTLELDMQSSGLSLLSPEVTVYASNGSTVLATADGEGDYGTTLTLSVSGVTAGEKFYVLARGADTTEMGTGDYALGLNFKGSTPPTEASPIVAEPDGTPEHTGGGQADGSGSYEYGIASPVISGITPDNGVSSSDGITNAKNISLFGAAPSNDVITIYCNGQAIGKTVALLGDTWTYNNTATTLSDGIYFFTAMATDPSGYTTPLSYPYEVTIDTHVPDSPILNAVSPETGSSGAVEYTNNNTPTFSGWTEPFAVVDLYNNGSSEPFGATEADISGYWSYTVGQPGTVTYPGASSSILTTVVDSVLGLLQILTAPTPPSNLANGTYNVTATAMDVAGTYSPPSSPVTIVVDTQPPPAPAITGISPDTSSNQDGVTTAHNLIISGTAQAGNSIEVTLNGTSLGTVMAGTNGAWSFNDTAVTLPDGNYTITAQAEDIAGNVSAVSSSFYATIETVNPPVIAGVSEATSPGLSLLGIVLIPSQQSLSVVGTATPDDSVEVFLDGTLLGTAGVNGQGTWTYSYVPSSSTVANGVYNFSAVTVDASGNVSSPTPIFQLQLGGPGAPTAGTPQYSQGILSGLATPGSLVTIVEGDIILGVVAANASGYWQFTPTLSNGKNSITVEATNGSGSSSLLSSALTVSA